MVDLATQPRSLQASRYKTTCYAACSPAPPPSPAPQHTGRGVSSPTADFKGSTDAVHRTLTMASEELARKLRRRLDATERSESPGDSPAMSPAMSPAGSPARCATEPPGDSKDEDPCSNELAEKLHRRLEIDGGGGRPRQMMKVFNPYTEFKEFTRKQIKQMEEMFKRFDSGKDGYIDLMELKMMMEKLGAPQTHIGLKNMIREVDEDYDGKLSYREFLLIFRRAAAGELQDDDPLMALARLSEINVKFEAELQEEKEEKQRMEEERKQRRAAFKELQSAFCS
ncbi:EF-hand domain-containing protein D2 [Bagarius yarrelli]|uniref:EF-hand domain-containing protein D2 n=1 Tax=Bagarius yarrelli TaxID=175774 RepID=A0A556TTQ5_BAGYA|nr:EF-hand domain-containing protein D2 [Bagarius yarrelli]